jgi:hypothetical protein
MDGGSAGAAGSGSSKNLEGLAIGRFSSIAISRPETPVLAAARIGLFGPTFLADELFDQDLRVFNIGKVHRDSFNFVQLTHGAGAGITIFLPNPLAGDL